jgi:serine/threonine-protein kinase
MQALLTGQLIAERYRVGRLLSAGGMGRIFSGVDEVDGTPVVIKVPQPDEAGSCANCERLEREARCTEPVGSPHLVRFVSAGCLVHGMPFLVLERLEGIDLGALIKQNGAVSLGVAVSYIRQACLGLAALHSTGVVHRDVKPSNLFLCTRGAQGARIKVIDLGLAKSTRAEVRDPALTGDHTLLGSPSYMSPEQMRQLELDQRSDVWSLGVVLFELLTGTRPFQAPTIVEVCAQILTQSAPRLRDRRADLDPALDAVIQRCLAKERADRYGSMLELSEALRPFDVAASTEESASSLPVEVSREPTPPPILRRSARSAPRLERRQVALTALLLVVTLAALWAAPGKWSTRAVAHLSSGVCEVTALRCDTSEPAPLRYARMP